MVRHDFEAATLAGAREGRTEYDEDGYVLHEAEDFAAVEREHANKLEAERLRLAQAAVLLRAIVALGDDKATQDDQRCVTMAKRPVINEWDFDTNERQKISPLLWDWHPAEAVIEAQTRNCVGDNTGKLRAVVREILIESIQEFHEENEDYYSKIDEVGDGHWVLPAAFFLHWYRICGDDWEVDLLRFGYFLMQVGEGIGFSERPTQLGPKIRDPESDLNYDAVGW